MYGRMSCDRAMARGETARSRPENKPVSQPRAPGPRTALRVVADTHGALPSESQLVGTAGQVPVLVAVGPDAAASQRTRLGQAGCEVLVCGGSTHAARLDALLKIRQGAYGPVRDGSVRAVLAVTWIFTLFAAGATRGSRARRC